MTMNDEEKALVASCPLEVHEAVATIKAYLSDPQMREKDEWEETPAEVLARLLAYDFLIAADADGLGGCLLCRS